jgi:hypothetical protein
MKLYLPSLPMKCANGVMSVPLVGFCESGSSGCGLGGSNEDGIRKLSTYLTLGILLAIALQSR